MNAAGCRLCALLTIQSALLGLSGCAVGPNYRPPVLDPPVTYAHQSRLPQPGEHPPALDAWWSGFEDPELDRIIERVLSQNLELSAAAARVVQARAVAREAGARELPEVRLDGSAATQRQSLASPLGRIAKGFPGYARDQTLRDIGVGADWELDVSGGLRRGAQAARADAEAAEAARMGIRVIVAAEAADAYFRLRGLREQIAVTQAQIDTDQQLLALVRQRQALGVAADLESAEAQALLSHARGALPPLTTELAAQANRLDVLMGVTPGTHGAELNAAAADYAIPSVDWGQGPAELLRRRPDVIAAERRAAAANARIGVAVAEYYPKVSLGALLGFEALNGAVLAGSAAFQPTAVAGLRWRLFDFGRVDAEVTQADGAEAEALLNFRASMLRATEDVENAIVGLTDVAAQRGELRQEVLANEQAHAAAQQEYVAGVVSFLEVLDAERQLLESRNALARARADEARAAVAAFRALGGGWLPPDRRTAMDRASGVSSRISP
jgi:NodT family efflux transporter outer membrane factor (OMF) lipoprotein